MPRPALALVLSRSAWRPSPGWSGLVALALVPAGQELRAESHAAVVQVGKTSIITRFMYDKFDSNYQVRLNLPERLLRSLSCFLARCAARR